MDKSRTDFEDIDFGDSESISSNEDSISKSDNLDKVENTDSKMASCNRVIHDPNTVCMQLKDLEDGGSISSNSVALPETNPMQMNFRAKFSSESSSPEEGLTPSQVSSSFDIKKIVKSKPDLITEDNSNYDGDDGTSSSDSDSVFQQNIPMKSVQCNFEPRKQYDQVPFSEQILTPDQLNQNFLFDSHCHIDRILSRTFGKPASTFFQPGPQPLKLLRNTYPTAFTSAFEGCINVITHPNQFQSKHWDWLNEPQLYLALGCHPENSRDYDMQAEYDLEKSLDHPKVIALGEIGLDDIWERRGVSFKMQTEVSFCTSYRIACAILSHTLCNKM